MGETCVEVKLKANGKEAVKKLLVDTGSIFSWIRTETLQKLEVKPTDKLRFGTIEGRRVIREISFVEVDPVRGEVRKVRAIKAF